MTRNKLYGEGGFAHAPGPEDDHFELFHDATVVLDVDGVGLEVAEKGSVLSLKSHMTQRLCFVAGK